MKKEELNAIIILSCFFVGLFLLILHWTLIKNDFVYSVGLGLFGASLTIGILELLLNRKR